MLTAAVAPLPLGTPLRRLISFVIRDDQQTCQTINGEQICTSNVPYPSAKVLGLALGALL